jgi:hypothetical protein
MESKMKSDIPPDQGKYKMSPTEIQESNNNISDSFKTG